MDKLEVQRVIGIHLDMYLPARAFEEDFDLKDEPKAVKIEAEAIETLRSIKEEDEEEEVLVDISTMKAEVRL